MIHIIRYNIYSLKITFKINQDLDSEKIGYIEWSEQRRDTPFLSATYAHKTQRQEFEYIYDLVTTP